jgi:hypothetical protein
MRIFVEFIQDFGPCPKGYRVKISQLLCNWLESVKFVKRIKDG